MESAAKDGEQYILVTPEGNPIRPAALVMEAALLWGKPGTLFNRGDRIGACFEDGKTVEVFTTGKKDAYVPTAALCPCQCVTLDCPVAVSTVPVSAAQVRVILDKAKKAAWKRDAIFSHSCHMPAANAGDNECAPGNGPVQRLCIALSKKGAVS